MRTFTLEQFRNLKTDLENKFSALNGKFWSVDKLVEVKDDEFVREVSEIRVYFDNEKIEEETGIDEFDIVTAYYDYILDAYVVECTSDLDAEKLRAYLS